MIKTPQKTLEAVCQLIGTEFVISTCAIRTFSFHSLEVVLSSTFNFCNGCTCSSLTVIGEGICLLFRTNDTEELKLGELMLEK